MKIMLANFASFIEEKGGSEQVCCAMANEMEKRGHEVSIVYCFGKSGKPLFPLNEKVKLYNLMAYEPKKWNGKKYISKCQPITDKIIRELIRPFSKTKAIAWNESRKGKLIQEEIQRTLQVVQPDIIISFWIETSYYLLNTIKTTIPVITMFHLDPGSILPTASHGELDALKKSALVQVLMEKDIDVVKKYCPEAEVIWIPNCVSQYTQYADLEKTKSHYHIINIARLDRTIKRQHLLIKAFARIAVDYSNWQVEFYGEDADAKKRYEKELRNMINDYKLSHQIHLMGLTSNVLSKYIHADIFCLPSKNEGFALSMTEAMSAGVPIVAFKSCETVRVLLGSANAGVLADDDVESLSDSLRLLMDDREKRIKLGRNGRKAMKIYAPGIIWGKWEKVIMDIICGENKNGK